MRTARLGLPLLAAAVLLVAAAACSPQTDEPSATALDSSAVAQDTTFSGDLLQILRRRQRFGVFTTLLDSAGFSRTLRGGGPYTVFAATDAGLDKLPEGLIDELLLPANRDRLRQVVAYHIHRGQLKKSELRGKQSVTTLAGQALPVAIEGGRVLIGGERVSEYAITGSNGRIFAFDALVIPPVGGGTVDVPPDTSILDTPASDSDASGNGTDSGPSDGDGGTENGGSVGSGNGDGS